jgi:hypothetical protein
LRSCSTRVWRTADTAAGPSPCSSTSCGVLWTKQGASVATQMMC